MKREDEIARVTLTGSVVNLLLVAMKAVAGLVGHSAAMISDAVHSLSDFVTDIVVLIFVRVSGRPQDEDHDYGHGKYETLATLFIGLALAAAAVGIVVSGAGKPSGPPSCPSPPRNSCSSIPGSKAGIWTPRPWRPMPGTTARMR